MAKLNSEQRSRFESQSDIDAVLALDESDIEVIDEVLLSFVTQQFQKVAKIVMTAIMKFDERGMFISIPDIYFGMRVESLVESRLLQGEGDLSQMRFSEVRLENSSS